ncbi:MAG: glycosyltransferase [Bacteroides sp.]|nr:glycosyltransferase [Bacteroides sp.]
MNFSVLMSVYRNDRAEWLKECLDSIFSQTLPAQEIILVIDGPIDTSLNQIISDYKTAHPELRPVQLEKNGGLGNALNIGLEHCSNEIIVRMDADDVCHPERFQHLISIFEKFPEIDAVSSWIDEFEDNINNIVSSRKLPEYPYELNQFAKARSPLNHAATAFKKSAILLSGGYKHYPLYEDYYLWARLLRSGFKIYNIQKSLLFVRVSPDMYKRRGGWKYAKTSAQFQWELKKMGIINTFQALKSTIIRGTVFLMPNSLRAWFYHHFLR